MRGLILGAGLALSGLAAIALLASQFGVINVAATQQDAAPVEWFLHRTYRNSVALRSEAVMVPDSFESDENVLIGARNFEAMCSTCHTPPGLGDTPAASGLNPRPPKLLDLAGRGEPQEQFWVISNGVRMTGMPAFGPTHEDSELWSLVAFLRAMDGGNAATYQSLLRSAKQTLRADDGHDHRHGPGDDNHGAKKQASEQNHVDDGHSGHAHDHNAPQQTSPDEHDHSTHDHGTHAHGNTASETRAAPPARNAAEVAANAFYAALASGDEAAVRQLLKPEVLIFESGGVETSADEYASGHMRSDMAFLKQATRTFISRESGIAEERAWVATRSKLQAQLGDRKIDVISTETLVMRQHHGRWQIEHVHWSSGKTGDDH